MAETVLMGGPLDIGMLFLPDATTGRCDDCSTKIVYRENIVTAELATVCVPCAAKRLRANPETIILGPSGASIMRTTRVQKRDDQ
jgi:hypothetical protein